MPEWTSGCLVFRGVYIIPPSLMHVYLLFCSFQLIYHLNWLLLSVSMTLRNSVFITNVYTK